MDRYIGLDVHMQSCTLAVVGPTGKRLSTEVVETNGAALADRIRAIPGRRHLCLEEGTQSAWLCEVLEPHVDELVVMVPGAKKGTKSDAEDAFARAEDLRRGAIDVRVFKAPRTYTMLRQSTRGYEMLTQDVVRAKNRLKSVFRSRGIQGAGEEIYEASTRKPWLERLPNGQRQLAQVLGQELDALDELQGTARQALLEASRDPAVVEVVRRLATAPGIGPIRAAQIAAIVVTPHRFRTRQQFWSYCGLAIVTHSSADWIQNHGQWVRAKVAQTRGLNRNRNATLKAVFKGAAQTVLQRMPDEPMRKDYERLLAQGTKPNLAALTIARKIASTVLAMWKHQEVYDPAKHRQPKTA